MRSEVRGFGCGAEEAGRGVGDSQGFIENPRPRSKHGVGTSIITPNNALNSKRPRKPEKEVPEP